MPPNFCPEPNTYAAIRMDPVAMVKDLDDPQALAAAEALEPKTYLVLIDLDMSLPMPGKPWYSFLVLPIGPSPPPLDNENCTTPNMCTPIYPNQSHPKSRTPLLTQPELPYTNCYQWSHVPSVVVRVLSREDGFDADHAITFPSRQRVLWQRYLGEDIGDMTDGQKALEEQATSASPTPAGLVSDGLQNGSSPSRDVGPVLSDHPDNHYDFDNASSQSETSSDSSDEQGNDIPDGEIPEAVNQVPQVDIFSNPNKDEQILPLVHLWLDLTNHLKQEDIPSPLDLVKEETAIVDIIKASRARNPPHARLEKRLRPWLDATMQGSQDGMGDPNATEEDVPKRKCFRPMKVLRKLKRRIRRLFTIPYIVAWP